MAERVKARNSDYLVPKDTFIKRTCDPNINSDEILYYKTRWGGYKGWNPADTYSGFNKFCQGSVLPNCTGYAVGRINEINRRKSCEMYIKPSSGKVGNAGTWFNNAINNGWKVSQTPMVGAIMCWTNNGAGHVAVVEDLSYIDTVEEINDGINTEIVHIKTDYIITTSESGYGVWYNNSKKTNWVVVNRTIKQSKKSWDGRTGYIADWMLSKGKTDYYSRHYQFAGFIYPPYSQGNYIPEDNSSIQRSLEAGNTNASSDRGYSSGGNRGGAVTEITAYDYIQKTREVERKGVLHTGDIENVDSKGTQLLSYPTLVETPFVIADIGGYTFGTYGTRQKMSDLGFKVQSVQYPDYIKSLTVEKVNGSINTYTLNIVYQIAAGSDPNLIDKILSNAGYGSTIKFTYGDYSAPMFKYKEEQAILTKVTSNVSFSNAQITYTIMAVSNSFNLWGTAFQFTDKQFKHGKPSDLIKSLFRNKKYGLQEIFYGMKSSDLDKYICSDDLAVDLEAQPSMDILTYINYLVTCMCSVTNDPKSIIRDSTYALVIHDDSYETDGYAGPYFTVDKIITNTKTFSAPDVYTIDIGFPSDTKVFEFNVNNDDSWALLYHYGTRSDFDSNNFIYKISDNGEMVPHFSPGLTTSNKKYITTEEQKTWWTQMTQHPVTATLRVKGLLRPALLMSYVKINALFYGQRHVSSGLYIITKQVDSISGTGYRTTLSLTRISGDDAYIGTYKATETYVERIKRLAEENGTYKGHDVEEWQKDLEQVGAHFSEESIKKIIDYNDPSNPNVPT